MSCNVLKLYKIGKFYNAYKDDGYIIHELMGYKFVEYKQSVGFPESAFSKVIQKLNDEKISYEIYEKNKVVDKYKGINKNYQHVLKKAINNINVENRVNRLKEIIDNCSNKEIEKIIEAIEDGRFK